MAQIPGPFAERGRHGGMWEFHRMVFNGEKYKNRY